MGRGGGFRPDVVASPDDEIDFIFPDFIDVFECCID